MTDARTSARIEGFPIAPGATAADRLLGYGSAVVGALLAGVLAFRQELGPLAVVLLAVVAFDLFGGVVVNALPSRARHVGSGSRWRSLGFVALHVHPLVLAIAVPMMAWRTAIPGYLLILAAAGLVLITPSRLRAPVAFGLAALLTMLFVTVLATQLETLWVLPVLVLKLLLAYLLPHHQPAPDTRALARRRDS